MNWNNASFDAHPQEAALVLISVSGVYYLAMYDAVDKVFRLKEDQVNFFDPLRDQIYWTEFHSTSEGS